MLKDLQPNPLNVFGLRRLDHCPPHFHKISFQLRTSEKSISDWIWTNLEGRFFYGDHYHRDVHDKIYFEKTVAFEIPGEASYFALMLDSLNPRLESSW
jgi:hypothetical protein